MWRVASSVLRIAVVILAVAAFAPRGEARTFKVLYSFCSQPNCADGATPQPGLVMDAAGNLYGATAAGGSRGGGGTVFKLTASGGETVLHSFRTVAGSPPNVYPSIAFVGLTSSLYGTTAAGGAHGMGTIFKISPSGHKTVLYSFCAEANCADGARPGGGLAIDGAGNLYGNAENGGTGSGVVFKLSPGGALSILYNFCSLSDCADGRTPIGPLLLDAAGDLFGTTNAGGNRGQDPFPDDQGPGTVFGVTQNGELTDLWSFCSLAACRDGYMPASGIITDGAGNFYGTTPEGGRRVPNGSRGGTVFKLTPSGQETVLYRFCRKLDCFDGLTPAGGLLMDQSGNLYGATAAGGEFHNGTVFVLTPSGKRRTLHSFCAEAECVDGAAPVGGLIMDAAGNLYGVTSNGGAGSTGTVFEIARD